MRLRLVCVVLLSVGFGPAGLACRGATDAVEPARAPEADTAPAVSGAVTVRGTVPQSTQNARSIVRLIPHAPVDVPVPTDPKVMDQLGRTFIPDVLITRVGQPVEFRNSELDLHNVRVIETSTGTTVMNVGMLMGNAYTQTFDRPGIYSVQCDIHSAMFADIVATETPYAVVTDREGQFSIPDVPLGEYTLAVRYGTQDVERVVTVTEDTASVSIEAGT